MKNITPGQPETGIKKKNLKIWGGIQNNLFVNLKKFQGIIPD